MSAGGVASPPHNARPQRHTSECLRTPARCRSAVRRPWDHGRVGISDRDSWLLREAYPTGRATGWRRTGCLLMLIVPVVLIVFGLLVALVANIADSDSFDVGDTRLVTVVVGECWRAQVEVDGRVWMADSSNAAPVAWGQDEERGRLTRKSDELAVFEAGDGERIELSGAEFHEAGCPLQGRS